MKMKFNPAFTIAAINIIQVKCHVFSDKEIPAGTISIIWAKISEQVRIGITTIPLI
jgi:hypothetical protein